MGDISRLWVHTPALNAMHMENLASCYDHLHLIITMGTSKVQMGSWWWWWHAIEVPGCWNRYIWSEIFYEGYFPGGCPRTVTRGQWVRRLFFFITMETFKFFLHSLSKREKWEVRWSEEENGPCLPKVLYVTSWVRCNVQWWQVGLGEPIATMWMKWFFYSFLVLCSRNTHNWTPRVFHVNIIYWILGTKGKLLTKIMLTKQMEVL